VIGFDGSRRMFFFVERSWHGSKGAVIHLQQLDGVGAWACCIHLEGLARLKRERQQKREPLEGTNKIGTVRNEERQLP